MSALPIINAVRAAVAEHLEVDGADLNVTVRRGPAGALCLISHGTHTWTGEAARDEDAAQIAVARACGVLGADEGRPGAVYSTRTHPALRGLSGARTKQAGTSARSVAEYLAAAAGDAAGRAVRVRVSTDPADAPEDCR